MILSKIQDVKGELQEVKVEVQDVKEELQDVKRRVTGVELHIENVTDKNIQQIMPVIRSFQTTYGAEYGRIMAATCLAVIPPVVLFAVFSKYIVKGFVLSGLK